MSENVNVKTQEDLKKLEEEAYFELCQIIAEALQLQDIQILNTRLSYWKRKYKKLIDGSTPNSALIQKIKALQSDQYIGYIVDLIVKRISMKEHVKIENQAKAIRKLYLIIKENNDLDTLKKKVAEWQKQYPRESFMGMYQRKRDYYTSTTNMENNAFNQKQSFDDLVYIIKIGGTEEELTDAIKNWKDKYSIGDKYKIDDFIKNQTEIKRYLSEDYLLSIAKNPHTTEDSAKTINSSVNTSSLSKQTAAFASLIAIAFRPNNIDKMFEWVYKNNGIEFNDEYKKLILQATYLDYSPTYLQQIQLPKTNLSTGSLSMDEYLNMDLIKRYAVISYFNLLLPPEKRLSNDYFKKHLREVYYKSEQVKHTSKLSISDQSLEKEPEITEVTFSSVQAQSNLDSAEDKSIDPVLEKKSGHDEVTVSTTDSEKELEIPEDKPVELKVDKTPEFTTVTVSNPEGQNEVEIPEDKSDKPKLVDTPEPAEITISNSEDQNEVEIPDDKSEEPKLVDILEPAKVTISDSEDQNEVGILEDKSDEPRLVDTPESAKVTISNSKTQNDINYLESETIESGSSTTTAATVSLTESTDDLETYKIKYDETKSVEETSKKAISTEVTEVTFSPAQSNDQIDEDAMIPLFFTAIHDYSTQASLIEEVNESVTKYANRINDKENKSIDMDLQKNNQN